MKFLSQIGLLTAGAIAALMLSTPASADAQNTINSYMESGSNLLEDDSGEMVWRWNDQGCDGQGCYEPVTQGAVMEGDLFGGVLDITWINDGTNDMEGDGIELTGIFLTVATSVTDNGDGSADIVFGSATADQWAALTGVNQDNLDCGGDACGDLSSMVAAMWADDANNLDLDDPNIYNSFANAQDGMLALIAGFAEDDDFFESTAALYVEAFGIGSAGVDIRGNFALGLSLLYWGLLGDFISNAECTLGLSYNPADATCHDLTGSGTLLVSSNGFPVQNDAQFNVTIIPEPGTLALMGLGLLGLGATGRRRRS